MEARTASWTRNPIVWGALLLILINFLHSLDHAVHQERGLDPITAEVHVVGALGLASAIGVLVLAMVDSRFAAPAAILVGLGTALGTVAVHWLPHWSAFSDPYPGLGLDAVSWAAMLILIGGGLVLAATGARRLRRETMAAAPAR